MVLVVLLDGHVVVVVVFVVLFVVLFALPLTRTHVQPALLALPRVRPRRLVHGIELSVGVVVLVEHEDAAAPAEPRRGLFPAELWLRTRDGLRLLGGLWRER